MGKKRFASFFRMMVGKKPRPSGIAQLYQMDRANSIAAMPDSGEPSNIGRFACIIAILWTVLCCPGSF